MAEKSRRNFLISIPAGLAISSLAMNSANAQSSVDPDIEAIKNRLLLLQERGASLSVSQKYFVLLACITTQALSGSAEEITTKAIQAKMDPVVLKEAVYQCSPYVGIGRVEQTLVGVNAAMEKAGIKLPLPSQTTVTDSNRLEKGIEVQTAIFGDVIKQMHKNATPDIKALQIDDLSGFCFGDFYTRSGLSVKDRELVVFAAIATLGGCESQLRSHINANLKEGNSRQNLIDALQVMVPYLGFPRTLNALAQVLAVKE